MPAPKRRSATGRWSRAQVADYAGLSKQQADTLAALNLLPDGLRWADAIVARVLAELRVADEGVRRTRRDYLPLAAAVRELLTGARSTSNPLAEHILLVHLPRTRTAAPEHHIWGTANKALANAISDNPDKAWAWLPIGRWAEDLALQLNAEDTARREERALAG